MTRARRTHLRGGRAHPAAVAGAIFILAISAAVVGWFILRAPRDRAGDAARGEAPPDIKNLQGRGGATNTLQQISNFSFKIADRDNPERMAGEIIADRSEPLESKRLRLDKPRAWWNLADGRIAYIRAEKGQMYIPEQTSGRPEEALLEGDVIVKIFDARPDGSRPDPDKDPHALLARTTRLEYDGRLGQISIPGRLSIQAPEVDFIGRGTTVVFNEVQQRLSLLRIEQTDTLVIRPGNRRKQDDKTQPVPPPAAPPQQAAAPGPGTPAAAPMVNLYHLVAVDDVVMTQAQRTARATTLEAWVRLIDNQLPDREAADARAAGRPLPISLALVAYAIASQQPETDQPPQRAGRWRTGRDNAEPITLSWRGPLEVRNVQAAAELTNDDVFLRLSSPEPDGVRLHDARAKATGIGALMEYAATSRVAVLASTKETPAVLTLPGAGRAEAQRFEIGLGSGMVKIPSGGTITADADTGQTRSVSWAERAEYTFAVVDGDITDRLLNAELMGGVHAQDGGSYLRTESLDADFQETSTGESRLSHLTATGGVEAGAKDGGSLTANEVRVRFEEGSKPSEARPRRMDASGSVRASRSGAVLHAGSLGADIADDEQGASIVTRAVAEGDAIFENDKGIRAIAERIDADPIAETATLTGEKVAVSTGGSTVHGTRVIVQQLERTFRVEGPGNVEHHASAESVTDSDDISSALVSWSRGMNFDDLTGTITCEGEISGALMRGPAGASGLDVIKADELQITLAPQESEEQSGPTMLQAGEDSRKILRATAKGDPAVPASVEIKRFAAAQGNDTTVERLLYLEGSTIRVDNEEGTLRVPGSGRLLSVDRRPDQPDPTKDDQGIGNGRGSTLFRWAREMSLERASGRAYMAGMTRLTHQPLAGDRVEMETDELTAMLDALDAAATPGTDTPSGKLRQATADGAVWLRIGAREITSDRMVYNAEGRIVEAYAAPGRTITMFDPARASPVDATEIVWNLANDRIDAKLGGTSPR